MTLPNLPEERPLSERINPPAMHNLVDLERNDDNATNNKEATDDDDDEKKTRSRDAILKDRRKRRKQWSTGVIGMAHSPWEQELENFPTSSWWRQSIKTSFCGLGICHSYQSRHSSTCGRRTRCRILSPPSDSIFASTSCAMFFMGLLILDVIILFTEVTLMALFPCCDVIQQDAISCVPAASSSMAVEDSSHHDRWLASSSSGHYNVCAQDDYHHGYDNMSFEPNVNHPVGCDSHKWQLVHQIEPVLFVIAMLILSCFFLELNVLVAVLKPRVFF